MTKIYQTSDLQAQIDESARRRRNRNRGQLINQAVDLAVELKLMSKDLQEYGTPGHPLFTAKDYLNAAQMIERLVRELGRE